MEEKKCTKCGRKLRSDNRSGVCGQGSAAKKCRERVAALASGDDGVLERVEASSLKPKKKPEPAEAPPAADAGPDWQRQFFQLAEALGLNPEEMLTDFCRGWVERTRARALATEDGRE